MDDVYFEVNWLFHLPEHYQVPLSLLKFSQSVISLRRTSYLKLNFELVIKIHKLPLKSINQYLQTNKSKISSYLVKNYSSRISTPLTFQSVHNQFNCHEGL